MRYDEWRGNFDGQKVLLIKKLVKRMGCVIQMHQFVKADNPGCFHTHPAWAIRIILWGGYIEERGDGKWKAWWPGRVGIVRPDLEHRIAGFMNGKTSYSLWIRGPKVRQINVRGC